MKRERRFLQSEVRMSLDGSEKPKITGYAAVFGKKSHNFGDFVEVIDAHAFDDCLASEPDIVGLFNHDDDMVLGRTSSGTMKVYADGTGLKYEIDPPATSYANDLMVSMSRGDIRSSSFAFYAQKEKWTIDPQTNENIRTILKARVVDCSVVTNPAYPDASSQLRSLFPEDKGGLPEEIRTNIAELRSNQRKEKRYRNIVAAVSDTAWAIMPEKLETICALLNARAAGHPATKEEIQAAMNGVEFRNDVSIQSGVAVIPVFGTISQRTTLMSEFCGGASCEDITRNFRAALNDPSVKAIVFDIDSPGGTVTGVPELGAEIIKARGAKPIIGVANGYAASAAYWIASACEKLYVLPSGKVGSVGVYCTHQDLSGALDKQGVSVSFIKAGKYKTDGNPYEPLSESAREEMQKSVDAYYEMFVSAVAAGRGVSVEDVEAKYGQGRMLMAKDALEAGMVDAINTLDEVVNSFNSDVAAAPPIAESVTEGSTEHTEQSMESCGCSCQDCVDGNCQGCSDGDCNDELCVGCGDDYNDDEDDLVQDGTEPEHSDAVVEDIKPAASETTLEEEAANTRAKYLVKLMQMQS